LLTFDDGPHPLHTPALLDELLRRGVSAVFFVLGECLESPVNRAILRRAAGDGHFIGNHGYSQQSLTHLTDDQIRSGFLRTEALIGNLDRGVKLWRPPFGDRDARVDSVLASLGYTRMLWNVDSLDWMNPDSAVSCVDDMLERIRLRQARGFRNTVCLLHDPLPATVDRLEGLLDRLGELPNTRMARYNPWHVDGLCVDEQAPHLSTNLSEDSSGSPLFPCDAVSLQLADARLVFRAQIHTLYVLNDSAALVWDAIASGVSPAEAAQTLARQYDIPEDLASQDVQSAITNWRSSGLLGPKAVESEIPGPWVRSSKEFRFSKEADLYGGLFEEEHAYGLLDARFRIRFQTSDLARAIHPRFANLETPACEAGAPESVFQVVLTEGEHVLDLPDGVATRHSSTAGLAYELFFEIMKVAYPDLDLMACLHSSLVASGDGAVALVGNNGSGKSTLAAALGISGMPALADDRLFLDFVTRRPVAAPNAIGLKRGSWLPLLSRYPDILHFPVVRSQEEEVRFVLPPPPTSRLLPAVQHVFFPRFSAAGATAARPLTPVQALERITAAEGWISADPEKLAGFLQWLEGLRCYELPYSSLDAAIEQIVECLQTGAA
jgi:peptidoglycan/xylan/chitin deacetylase (PgdA/CDA1 family)